MTFAEFGKIADKILDLAPAPGDNTDESVRTRVIAELAKVYAAGEKAGIKIADESWRKQNLDDAIADIRRGR